MNNWVLIDDSPDEAAAFAKRLTLPGKLAIAPLSATEAKNALSSAKLAPLGVLMDVDLSNETGMLDTGPGMAQSIRIAQNRKDIPSFPVVRFSLRARVLENIGRDSSSDDIFDLKIEKDDISDHKVAATTQQKLLGVGEVYRAVESSFDVPALLGLNDEQWLLWGHPTFEAEVKRADRPYLVAARQILLLVHPGLLIEEALLAFRLGIDREASVGWPDLLKALTSIRYSGVASDFFPRWWARGLEAWWSELTNGAPLAASSIDDRFSVLAERFSGLTKLSMPKGSLGDRPWRYCFMTFEEKGQLIPLDPARAVKLAPRSTLPAWLDPLYVALGPALRGPDYPGLDKEDLARLKILAKQATQ